MVSRVKGTQDFLDLRLFKHITSLLSSHVGLYHFNQIATPILEHTALFKRSLGESTDVVSKEMFLVQTPQGSEQICLRPEATAPTVRAFLDNHIAHTPWKIFSYGPMFRYERPQKGRFRQFNQFNIEVIGSELISEDVQLITMLERAFQKLQLTDYALKINFLGTFEDRKQYTIILKEFLLDLAPNSICKLCTIRCDRNPMRVFDCKNKECQIVYQSAPKVTDHLSDEAQQEYQTLKEELDSLSISYSCDPTLVRGLDYYNKTVFEFVSGSLGSQSAFCAGGRYDGLVTQLGGKEPTPSLGAAIGIERLLLMLEPIKDSLAIPELPPLHVIVPLSANQRPLALLLADELRAHAICTDIILRDVSMKSLMRHANKMGATYVLLLGEEEQQNRTVTLKNMVNGLQQQVNQADLVQYLKK